MLHLFKNLSDKIAKTYWAFLNKKTVTSEGEFPFCFNNDRFERVIDIQVEKERYKVEIIKDIISIQNKLLSILSKLRIIILKWMGLTFSQFQKSKKIERRKLKEIRLIKYEQKSNRLILLKSGFI